MGGEAVIALFLFQEIEPQRRNFKVTEVMRAEKFRSSFYSWFVVIAFQTLLFILFYLPFQDCCQLGSLLPPSWGGEVSPSLSPPGPTPLRFPETSAPCLWASQAPGLSIPSPAWAGVSASGTRACTWSFYSWGILALAFSDLRLLNPSLPPLPAHLWLSLEPWMLEHFQFTQPVICYLAAPGSLPGLNFRTTHPGSLGSDFLPRGFRATSPCALSPFSLDCLPAPPRGPGAEQSWAAPLDSMHLSTADLCFSLFMISTDAWQYFKIFPYYKQFQAFRKVEKIRKHSSFSLRNSPILISLHSSLICIVLNAIILHTSVPLPLMFLQCGMPFPAQLAWLQLILRPLLQGLHPNPCLRLVTPLYVHKMPRCS